MFESMEKKSDDHLLNSWFPIGFKFLSKVGEVTKHEKEKTNYYHENNLEKKIMKFPLKMKYNMRNVCKSEECFEAGKVI